MDAIFIWIPAVISQLAVKKSNAQPIIENEMGYSEAFVYMTQPTGCPHEHRTHLSDEARREVEPFFDGLASVMETMIAFILALLQVPPNTGWLGAPRRLPHKHNRG